MSQISKEAIGIVMKGSGVPQEFIDAFQREMERVDAAKQTNADVMLTVLDYFAEHGKLRGCLTGNAQQVKKEIAALPLDEAVKLWGELQVVHELIKGLADFSITAQMAKRKS